jgi:excisionase family DNA binding protein
VALTVPASAASLGDRLPNKQEREVANQLRGAIASGARLRFHDSQTEIVLLPGVKALLMEVLRHIGSGDAVTIVPISQMLTTQQAADILNVSRPYLIGLLEKGEIEYNKVGRHRRIRAELLFAYKAERDARRASGLTRLAELDAELI